MKRLKEKIKRCRDSMGYKECEQVFGVIKLFVEDVARDLVGKRIPGKNPIRLRNSTLHERDAYMNCADQSLDDSLGR
jgi:hypothetical protein